MIKLFLQKVANSLGYQVNKIETRPNRHYFLTSWDYQQKFVDTKAFRPDDIIVDFGCGNNPVPIANVLADFFPDDNFHRSGSISDQRPTVICSLERIPFLNKSIRFAMCSHVFEHLERPYTAGKELGRVALSGLIETPAYGKDILVGTGYMHLWQIVSHENKMHFFQYTQRQHEAHTLAPIMNYWGQAQYHPWQEFFWERQDLFNAIHVWNDSPDITEYRLSGSIAKPLGSWIPVSEDALPQIPVSLNDREIQLLERCLSTPDGTLPMHYEPGFFVSSDGNVRYPVRGNRIYCELPDTTPVKL